MLESWCLSKMAPIFALDGGRDLFQGLVAVAREFIEVFDDGKDVDAHRSGVGPDEGHVEAVAALEGGLHVGHELQGGVIGH